MNGEIKNIHLQERTIDQYVEGELSRTESMTAETHLASCSHCRQSISQYQVFLSELNALPHPPVPSGFAVRILNSIQPNEDVLIIRWMTKAYAGVAVALAAVAATVLGASGGPGPVAGTVATGFGRTMWDGLSAGRDLALGAVDMVKAAFSLLPMAEAAGSLARGFETTAFAIAAQYSLILTLTCVMATLVLIWATSPARERGVPHVSLSL